MAAVVEEDTLDGQAHASVVADTEQLPQPGRRTSNHFHVRDFCPAKEDEPKERGESGRDGHEVMFETG
jgi:hypothetical protein